MKRHLAQAHMSKVNSVIFTLLIFSSCIYVPWYLVFCMKKQINDYHFGKIASRMTRDFGSIEKNREEKYDHILFPMESNLVKTNRKSRINSGRSTIEAIHICLFMIDGYLNQTEYDLDPYISDTNSPYSAALLMCFDPFTNEYLRSIVEESFDIHSREGLRNYFDPMVKCLLRIEKSIELWTKEYGDAGYYRFLEKQIGVEIANNDIMDCVILN